MKIVDVTKATKPQLIKELKRLGLKVPDARDEKIAAICYKRGFNDCKSNPSFCSKLEPMIEIEEEKTTLLIDQNIAFEMTKDQAEAVEKVCDELGIFYEYYVPYKVIKI